MPDSWTAFGLELPLVLARTAGGGSLRTQLEDALRSAVRDGRLAMGTRLPSSRTLASDLGLARGTVVEAYRQLIAEGYLTARGGSGTSVAAAPASSTNTPATSPMTPKLRWDFRPSLPDLTLFPRATWAKALSRTVRDIPYQGLGYGDPRGTASLRTELAGYLRRVRNVAADPEQIVICSGFTQGLALICRVLTDRGAFAVEDPGSPSAWERITDAGIDCVGLPVDDQGLSVTALAASQAQVVLTTPAHQFPTGVTLAPERRTALLAWAAAGGLVIEDDYDAEFRYDLQPVGALQGLAPERVLYAGSVSKTFAPCLRLGWLVLPASLVDDVTEAKRIADMGSPTLDQYAFTQLLASGAYDRHLRRARHRYRAKRDALLTALDRHAPQLGIHGVAAGLHALITLPDNLDEHAVVTAARRRGVGVYPLSDHRLPNGSKSQPNHALVLGYGGMSELTINAGIAQLGAVLSAARGTNPA